jgi:spore germination cell wall hydrolase CwlJ-like protein
LKRIFRAAGIAAAAVAFVAAASSPSFAGNLEGTPDPGFTAHEVASVADSDLGVNGVEPPVETPQAESPNRFKSMFNHAWAWIASDREAAPAAATGPASKLSDLVETFSSESDPEGDQDCLANAVYFEARSEPIEGQLAVAEVVLNRAASGIYPSTECAVIKQHAQFSFIRKGEIPQADKSSTAWRTAVAIAHIAKERLVTELAPNILWYHADYVSPRWGRRLTRQTKIGLHIFYS